MTRSVTVTLIAIIFLLVLCPISQAQSTNVGVARVVASCGTLPNPKYNSGQSGVYLTLDTNGEVCINGTITGGNSAASATGSAVPANAGYTGANFGGTLMGLTGTTVGGSKALDVNVVQGGGGGSTIGGSVPSSGIYNGINVAGTLRGQTGVNPTGSVYAMQVDLTSMNGSSLSSALPVSGTFWQTTQPVSLATLPALTAGSAKVGIFTTDQTTPGTTDLVHAAEQGNWTVQPGNTQNTTPWLVSVVGNSNTGFINASHQFSISLDGDTLSTARGSAVTETPILNGCEFIASPSTLSTGQKGTTLCDDLGNALVVGTGTAGSAAGGVLTVQGVASMTPFLSNPGTAANWAIGATGSAVPANAIYPGAINTAGNLYGDVSCDKEAIYDASTNGATQLVAISGSTHIYICGYDLFAAGTVNVSLVVGTGTNCASAISGTPSTGTTGAAAKLTPAYEFTAQTGKISSWPTHGWLFDSGSANALCINTSAGVAVQANVYYTQR